MGSGLCHGAADTLVPQLVALLPSGQHALLGMSAHPPNLPWPRRGRTLSAQARL